MKLAARNKFSGIVNDIEIGRVVSKVSVMLKNGEIIKSIITTEAVESLKLEVGRDVFVVIKATDVMLGVPEENETLSLSSRNVMKGTVKAVTEHNINSIVKVDVGGLTFTSFITTEALKELGIKEGMEIFVIVKASNVMMLV